MKADTGAIAGATPARRSQKEATRQRVLAAARELFDTHGYQGATIRDIARHAGVAVGSVFTTFDSKGEILSEVMKARLDTLYVELDRVLPHLRGATVDRLRTLFGVFVEFEAQHMHLFLSHIAAAYDWTLSPESRPFGRAVRLQAILRDCLERGKAEGDVRPDADVEELVHLLKAAYAWSYSFVVSDGWGAAEQAAFLDRQIGLIADGFRPR